MTAEPAVTVDALGRRCPVPVIELANHISEVAVGEVVAVLTDDEAARIDIPVWCRMKGHEFLLSESAQAGTRHLVRRLS